MIYRRNALDSSTKVLIRGLSMWHSPISAIVDIIINRGIFFSTDMLASTSIGRYLPNRVFAVALKCSDIRGDRSKIPIIKHIWECTLWKFYIYIVVKTPTNVLYDMLTRASQNLTLILVQLTVARIAYFTILMISR